MELGFSIYMEAFKYLKSLPWIPRKPSNSELWRWLNNKSIMINGATPSPKDEVEFPIEQLIFFKGEKKVTMVDR